MRNIILSLGFAAICLLQGAGAMPVEYTIESSDSVNFSRLKTFAWLESHISYAEVNDAAASDRLETFIRSTVADSLAEKGYQQLPAKGQPDFLISYHVVVTREDNVSPLTGLRAASHAEPALQQGEDAHRKGTLIIYAVDAASKRLLWQSVGATTAPTTCEALKATSTVVERMLEEFPSKRSI